jgi:hypothetical protein
MKFIFSLFLFLVVELSFAQSTHLIVKSNEHDKTVDYTLLKNWAAHPFIKDFSDSLPIGINALSNDKNVDVFFVHPTTFTDKNDIAFNADLDNTVLNDYTDKSTILYQASAFNANANVYAPRYRQAHIRCFYIDSLIAEPFFEMAYADVKSAFEYYLAHYNHGNSIIIASHSQGTVHAARLLKEFFEDKALGNKLICAYLIGMPIRTDYFSKIKPCENGNETGCFVSWRTYKKGYEPLFVQKEHFKAVVTNPLTWSNESTEASIQLNKGGVLKDFSKIVPRVVDAQVHGNILWACKPNVFGKIFFFAKNFHIGDINLYYMNIRENVSNRIKHYQTQ